MNMEHSAKLERETEKISLRRSRSPDNAKFGHFKLRTRRNLQRFMTHMHSHCSAH